LWVLNLFSYICGLVFWFAGYWVELLWLLDLFTFLATFVGCFYEYVGFSQLGQGKRV
jgi:hypothetical protein